MSVKRLRGFLTGEELDPDNTDWREDPPLGEGGGEKKRRGEGGWIHVKGEKKEEEGRVGEGKEGCTQLYGSVDYIT